MKPRVPLPRPLPGHLPRTAAARTATAIAAGSLAVVLAAPLALPADARTASSQRTGASRPDVGPDGTSSMHGDAAASDTTPYAGPGPDAQPVQPVVLGAVCPTILAGRDRMPLALCTEYVDRAPTANLLDPTTLLPVARLHLSAGALLGGVYAYVDGSDRLVTVDGGTGDVVRIAHDQGGPGGTWRLFVDDRFPVAPALTRACGAPGCDAIVSVAPGYDGRIWFATAKARAGYVDPRTGRVRVRALAPAGRTETVANSIATALGGVAITTDHALVLVRADARGAIRTVWRRAYERGPARKPGQLTHGSGATPTFLGSRTGGELVAITDDASPREHLLVYRSDTGRLVCRRPLFRSGASGTENSPIGLGSSVYVASTYGYPYPAGTDGPSEPASAPIAGGLERVDLTADGCRTRWRSDVASAAVPRLSRAERVIYTVIRDGQSYALGRISPRTGRVLSSQPIGVGPASDTLQMVGTILPDRTLLQGTMTGFVAVRAR